MKNIVLSATILFSASQAHAGPFGGTYLPQGERDNGATCQSLNGIFDGKTPYRIEEGWIEYMESGCKLSKPTALSDGSIRYQASCATEGTEFREKLTISPANGGIVLKGDGWQEYWKSCSIDAAINKQTLEELDGLPSGMNFDEGAYKASHWQLSSNVDANTALLVQQVVADGNGGNVAYFNHSIITVNESGIYSREDIFLNGSISNVTVSGVAIVIDVSVYKDGDARCCPSGIEKYTVKVGTN